MKILRNMYIFIGSFLVSGFVSLYIFTRPFFISGFYDFNKDELYGGFFFSFWALITTTTSLVLTRSRKI